MITFLEKTADKILENGKENLSDVCIVFPSRRAGTYFRDVLSKKLDSPVWSPTIFSIEDFFADLSPYTIADSLLLIFELHKIYMQEESFDKFYSWGEMVLRDFNDIDKYFVDAQLLFKKVKDYKNIEEEFPVEMSDEFRNFWKTILDGEYTELKSEFVKIWEELGDIYTKFRASLKEKELAYEGMAHRDICERFLNEKIETRFNKIYFAGFNSLNKCEENIMSKLVSAGKAEMIWDYDDYYINDDKQEAGFFLRKNFKTFNYKFVQGQENCLLTGKRNISITGIPLSAGEAKLAGSIIKKLSGEKDFVPEKTAVVIPDETLVLPVLYSLPDSVKSLNVTMGFRFKSTPLHNLLQILKSLQNNLKSNKGKTLFYHKDVAGILLHPYIKIFDAEFNYELYWKISKENYVYLSTGNLDIESAPEILKFIFRDAGEIGGIFTYLRTIIEMISSKFEENQNSYEKFQLEYIYTFILQLNRFDDILKKYKTSVSRDTFWKILVDILATVTIPLTGEPLKGLQLMGLLETRAIDFENVIILSMNEGIIPGGRVHNSFIPYPLRRQFKMPVYQDNDAVTAYYIYRLLQKAKNIYLIYNTESDNNAGGISRFLLQVEYELSKLNSNITFSHSIASTKSAAIKKKEIKIRKSDDILNQVKGIKSFSATALTDYLNCKLQFYLKRIAGLKEEEEVLEVLDSASLGSVLHEIMKMLYTPYLKKEITEGIIDNISKRLKDDYDNIFRQGLISLGIEKIDITLQGRNILIKDIIKKLAERILKNDRNNIPYIIEGLELVNEGKLKIDDNLTMNLKGKFDRIEKKDDVIRIIDYKTSDCAIKPLSPRTETEFFERLITDTSYKETFQTFLYSYLYYINNKSAKVLPGLYLVRKSEKSLVFAKETPLTPEELNKFEDKLKIIFQELLNPETEFTQTEDESRCLYCDFKSLCYRE